MRNFSRYRTAYTKLEETKIVNLSKDKQGRLLSKVYIFLQIYLDYNLIEWNDILVNFSFIRVYFQLCSIKKSRVC